MRRSLEGLRVVNPRDALELAHVNRDVVCESFAPRAGRSVEPAKCVVEALEVIELLPQRVAEKYACPVVVRALRQQRFQLLDMIGAGRLDAELGSQQIACVMAGVDRNGAIAGRLGFRQPSETSLAARQVVPESRIPRRKLGGAPVELVGPVVLAQSHRNEGKAVVGISRPGFK